MLNKLKDLWWGILVAIAIGTAYVYITNTHTLAGEAKSLAEQNAGIAKQLSTIIKDDNRKLAMFLEFSGFDLEQARVWAAIPRGPKTDSLGNIVPGVEWLVVRNNLNTGLLYMRDTTGIVYVDTLWRIEEKNK